MLVNSSQIKPVKQNLPFRGADTIKVNVNPYREKIVDTFETLVKIDTTSSEDAPKASKSKLNTMIDFIKKILHIKTPTAEVKKDEGEKTVIGKATIVEKKAAEPSTSNEYKPSSSGQLKLAKMLKKELVELGLKTESIEFDPKTGVVSAVIPHNLKDYKGTVPTIGLFAHMDTSPDVSGKDVNPIKHKYTGGDINLPKGETVIKADELKRFVGDEIITSDGSTLLGADDKAGIASILGALMYLKDHPEVKHPTIKVAFTPDEEIFGFVTEYNLKNMGVDAAYTVDGEDPYALETENFNAKSATFKIKGKNYHTGHAFNKLLNSILVAVDILNGLPKDERPETTEGREGFIHVDKITGTVDETEIKMMIRDHDSEKCEQKAELLKELAQKLSAQWDAEVNLEIKDTYYNMKEMIDKNPEVVELAQKAIKDSGLEPEFIPIRGATEGAAYAQHGIPAPNFGPGGHNFHSKAEFLSVNQLMKSVEVIVRTLNEWGQHIQKPDKS